MIERMTMLVIRTFAEMSDSPPSRMDFHLSGCVFDAATNVISCILNFYEMFVSREMPDPHVIHSVQHHSCVAHAFSFTCKN